MISLCGVRTLFNTRRSLIGGCDKFPAEDCVWLFYLRRFMCTPQQAFVTERRKEVNNIIERSLTSLVSALFTSKFQILVLSKILVKVEKLDYIKVIISITHFNYVGKPCYDIHLQFAIKGFSCHKREITNLRNFMIEAPRQVSLVLAYTVFSEASEYDIYIIYFVFVLRYIFVLIWNRSWW